MQHRKVAAVRFFLAFGFVAITMDHGNWRDKFGGEIDHSHRYCLM
jgi:hypothetical protein